MFKILFITGATMSLMSSACLITNCPRGGKRSDRHGSAYMLENIVAPECPGCGRQGQCFGPNICCGTSFGCLIATPETLTCQREMSLYTRPCIAGYAMCKDSTGRCAANGICCTQDACYVDSTCKISDQRIYNAAAAAAATNHKFTDEGDDDLAKSTFIENYQ